MLRTLSLLLLLALVAAGCGDDSSLGAASGDTDEFCRLAVAQNALDDQDTTAADLEPFLAAAPGSIRGDIERIQQLFAEIEEIEATEGDEAAFGALIAAGTDSEVNEAFDNLERFLSDECGLDLDDDGATDDGSGTTGDASLPQGRDCGDPDFAGTVSSDGDDFGNTPFNLSDGQVSTAEAFALDRGANYTVYLADYDLGDQEVGLDTVQADPGQVVVTLSLRNEDFSPITIGESFLVDFVIMDSGGGPSGSPVDPIGTATMNGMAEDRICFDIDFSDEGEILQGSVTAEVVGGF